MNKTYNFKNVAKFIFDNIGAELFGEIKNNKLSVAVLGNCVEIDDFFKKCGINSEYHPLTKNNLNSVISFLKDKNNMPKFDVIVGNPPYGETETTGSADLHYEIAEKLFGLFKHKMIFIMPGRVCFSTSEKFDKWKLKFDNLSNISFVGNPFKNANVNVDMFIFEPHKVNEINVRGKIYKSLFDIVPFTDYENKFMSLMKNEKPNYNSFSPRGEDKTTNAKKFNDNYFNRFKDNDYFVISCIANGSKLGQGVFLSSKDEKYIFRKNELKLYLANHKNYSKVISVFKTKNAANNYVNALQRPLLRFGLVKMQDDQNLTARCYKYIPDIDWNDNRAATDVGILEMCGSTKKESKEFSNYCEKIINEIDAVNNTNTKKNRKVKVNTVSTIDKEQINKLNAKAMDLRKTFTSRQALQFKVMFDGEWAKINKRIDLNNKLERSLAFAKARVACAKKVLM